MNKVSRGLLALACMGTGVALAAPPAGSAGLTPLTSFPGSWPSSVAGATDLGAAPGGLTSVTLVLPLRHQAALRSLLGSLARPGSPRYHRFLTPAAFAARFAPSSAAAGRVRAWAERAGLQVTGTSPNRTLVEVQGSSTALGAALGVHFDRFSLPSGQTYVSNTTPAVLPGNLRGAVSAIVGLSTLGRVQLAPVVSPSSGLSFPTSYDPQQFWSFYNAPASETGQGQTLAILAEGDLSGPQADLRTFEQRFGLPQVPWTTVPVGAASSDTSGDTEWDLDTQYSTGFAPGVSSLLVYDTTSLSNGDVLAEMNRFVTDDAAKQASFSAGECQVLADATGFLAAGDQVLEEAAAQGQTLFAASGDTGSFCPALVGVNGVPAGLPDVNYPAASPYAVGVGGTTILGLPSPLSEIAWYAGGGGQALLEAEPGYQAAVGGSNLGLRRGVPDVALDADPNSGYDVIVGGQEQVVGGTSASSPSWLGIWTRAQGAKGGTLGFANDTIYAEPASSFNDIVAGTNGIYPATPGYDYVTGRGTPNITAFLNAA